MPESSEADLLMSPTSGGIVGQSETAAADAEGTLEAGAEGAALWGAELAGGALDGAAVGGAAVGVDAGALEGATVGAAVG